jgi:hypothetical protein
MLKRTRRTLWIVAAVVVLLAAAVYLRFKAPPEAARAWAWAPAMMALAWSRVKTALSGTGKLLFMALPRLPSVDRGVEVERDAKKPGPRAPATPPAVF